VAWERPSDETSAFVGVGRRFVMLGSDHDRVDPAEALLREVGAQLREVRLERGEDLDEVAKALRIKPAYLFGIEQGDLSALPGRTYALGFLRTYADHLGFDGADLVARIRSSVGELTDRTRLRIRTPMPENRLPRTPLVVISLAVVFGIYLGWSYVNRSGRVVMDTVAEVPEELRAPSPVDAPEDTPTLEEPPALAAGPDGGAGAADNEGIADMPAVAPGIGTQASNTATPAPGPDSAGTMVAARTPEATEAGSSAPLDPPHDAPDRMIQPAAPQADGAAGDGLTRSEREALSQRPAAGGEWNGPATVATPERQSRATGDVRSGPAANQTDADGAAQRPDHAADMGPARGAVALLLDSAAGQAGGALRVYERANTDARVILRARAQAWIQVSSPAGDYTFTRTLEPGEAVLVPNRADLELWTGNARGLDIIVDGTPVPALAGGGAVRRNVSLDPDRLLEAAGPAR
jgi:cytoskeleton protein RodZ